MPLAYPCGTTSEAPEGHYSRLCPRRKGDWDEHDGSQLQRLACELKDSPEKREARAKQRARITTMPSGYVYFGQFIDHDITRDIRELKDATPRVDQICNYRTPRLDLESLYGKVPENVPCIYEDDRERLRLGPTLPATSMDGSAICSSLDDLPRIPLNGKSSGVNDTGTAVIIDPRNDENLIVAQMHVLFAKFHNRALELIRQQGKLSPKPPKSLFERTRRFVTRHYQWLILHDFLPWVARKVVLNDIKAGSKPRLFQDWYAPTDAPIGLPVEFSVAAFRFGHSMVRNGYSFNGHLGILGLEEIIRMTKRGYGIVTKLPANYVISWKSFFYGTPGQLNRAEPIDGFVSEKLYDIPKQTAGSFRFQSQLRLVDFPPEEKMIPSLPETTLRRGSQMRLPSGEEFARRFKFKPLEPKLLFPRQETFFERGLNGRTPLWYYLLREAAIEPNRERRLGSLQLQKLGTIGSRIVAETIYQLLHADRQSILHEGRGWKPPVFVFGSPPRCWRISSMSDLARFVDAKI